MPAHVCCLTKVLPYHVLAHHNAAANTHSCTQARSSHDRVDFTRRRLSSDQACAFSCMGSTQLSGSEQHIQPHADNERHMPAHADPSPPGILLQLKCGPPDSSADAYSGPRASCNVLAVHPEDDVTEVSSPRKAPRLPRQMEFLQPDSSVGRQQCLAGEVQPTCAIKQADETSAMEHVPHGLQARNSAARNLPDRAAGTAHADLEQRFPCIERLALPPEGQAREAEPETLGFKQPYPLPKQLRLPPEGQAVTEPVKEHTSYDCADQKAVRLGSADGHIEASSGVLAPASASGKARDPLSPFLRAILEGRAPIIQSFNDSP